MNKWIINWELSLRCNLDCSFCSQKERREEQEDEVTLDKVLAIIENLPSNTHISFLGWETLIFPNICEVFGKLDNVWITYEITTNGALLQKIVQHGSEWKNLTHITISIDGYGEAHDTSRWKVGLFQNISEHLPNLFKRSVPITISTVVTLLPHEEIVTLHRFLSWIGVQEHKLIYCMNFSEEDVTRSCLLVPGLDIASPGGIGIQNTKYKRDFFEKVLLLKKLHTWTRVTVESGIIAFSGKDCWCKQLERQFRINHEGKLSLCEFIKNASIDLTKTKFVDAINDAGFCNLKKEILEKFPLPICTTCCKAYKK